ncbi:hypothetical protein [Siphonobacter sp. SORGH_AS_0500]|uniref:hypothetical protein n=1 Tax=Siphonobacter sp. SORGH_AS_0500 TaxID=1864824 RepID=UPI0012FF5606|nr:hypothetical protein [Siphonobacter sp. SORGH_AS_0500]
MTLRRTFPLIICLIPIIAFYLMLYHFSVNLPWTDDSTFMHYVYQNEESRSNFKKILIETFSVHADHRIAVPRVVMYLIYLIEGEINLRSVILIGNLSILGCFFIVLRYFQISKLSLWFFVPVSFLLFQPVYWEDALWPICVLQHSLVIFLVLVSLQLLQKEGKWFLMTSIIFAVLAIYTSGNGLLILIPGVLLLLFQKRKIAAVIWSIGVIVAIICYFIDFTKGGHTHVTESLLNPIQFIKYILVFLGANVSLNYVNRAIFLGILILLVWGIAFISIIRTKDNKFLPIWGLLTFLILSAGLVSLSRSWVGVGITARYQIYATYAVTTAYVLFVALINKYDWKKYLKVPLIIGTGLYVSLIWFIYWPIICYRKDLLVAETVNWKQNGFFLTVDQDHNLATARFYPYLVKKRLYTFPQHMYAPDEDKTSSDKVINFQYHPDEMYFGGNSLVVEVPDIDQNIKTSYLILKDSSGRIFLAPLKANSNSIKNFLRTGLLFSKGGNAIILVETLPQGTYQFGLYSNNQVKWLAQKWEKQ